jgi:hypothetical protein
LTIPGARAVLRDASMARLKGRRSLVTTQQSLFESISGTRRADEQRADVPR